uniref:Biotin carboxyl carrier protein of acetyl-CoA carboxylase n=1 Tax=Erythroglossum lusitanicum TaxID=2575615 RepID=A0A4D6WU02_9FLOR|nr:acetyl-CoA carboxylase, biotin carboxyl carrier protein [Erythroglossum lusitanicum]
MIFQLKNLKKFIRSIQKYQIDKINIKSKNFNIIINKTKIKKNIYSNKITNIPKVIDCRNKNNNTKIVKNKIETKNNNNILIEETKAYSTIVSPMVGTFYRSPAPNEPVFIEKNDIVQKKQTVCIIEAMKLMNEIEAEISGEIVEILVNDGDIVDCGQALMKLKIL